MRDRPEPLKRKKNPPVALPTLGAVVEFDTVGRGGSSGHRVGVVTALPSDGVRSITVASGDREFRVFPRQLRYESLRALMLQPRDALGADSVMAGLIMRGLARVVEECAPGRPGPRARRGAWPPRPRPTSRAAGTPTS